RIEFGGIGQVGEAVKDVRAGAGVEREWRDVLYALRTLRRSPGFAVTAVVTIALAVGANTTIFSLADQLLLRRLPVRDPQQLVLFDDPSPFPGRQFNTNTFSYPMYRDIRDRVDAFDGVIAYFATPLTLSVDDRPERVLGQIVTGNYFNVLGVRPALGRLLTPD